MTAARSCVTLAEARFPLGGRLTNPQRLILPFGSEKATLSKPLLQLFYLFAREYVRDQ